MESADGIEFTFSDQSLKSQDDDSSASEYEARGQICTNTDPPPGEVCCEDLNTQCSDSMMQLDLKAQHPATLSLGLADDRTATCSLTLDSELKEQIEPKPADTVFPAQTAASSSTVVPIGKKCKRPRNLKPPDCIITLESSSEDESAPPAPKVTVKSYKEVGSYVIIDSDSDDDRCAESKKEKIESGGLFPRVVSVQSCAPILIIDDDELGNVPEAPVLTEESRDQKVSTSADYESNSADGEKLYQSSKCSQSKDSYGRQGVMYKEYRPVLKQSVKKKRKGRNKVVIPAGKQPIKMCKPVKKSEKEEHETKDANCDIPGCFLRGIETEKCYSGKNFKRNRDELVQKFYALFNSSVFDNKLPKNIDIKWNNKMLRTAGLCTTCRISNPKKQRYAKIDIAPKVCDSADRLRDTLIHEMCHVASWLLDGIHNCHGRTWKYYARKSNMVHPELPKITRCHSYKINYKVHYECTQCKSRVGRYSKSLNTDRFICGNCWGPLVLVPLTRKDGTPIAPHVRPFAKFVKEHYRVVRKKTAGISHGDVMRELSKAFFAKKQRMGA